MKIIFIIILSLCGGITLGSAINDYKENHYILGSISLMTAIVDVMFIAKFIFMQ